MRDVWKTYPYLLPLYFIFSQSPVLPYTSTGVFGFSDPIATLLSEAELHILTGKFAVTLYFSCAFARTMQQRSAARNSNSLFIFITPLSFLSNISLCHHNLLTKLCIISNISKCTSNILSLC